MGKKKFDVLSLIAAVLMMISACIGIFYSNGGSRYEVVNTYGEKNYLFGDGIYAHDTILKAATGKGTDITMLVVGILIVAGVLLERKYVWIRFVKVSLLSGLLYDAICLVTEYSINRIYILYLVIFSTALYSLIWNIAGLMKQVPYPEAVYEKRFTGALITIFFGGCSTLCWMIFFILPATLSGDIIGSIDALEIYTTVPTFALDLGIIFPACILSSVWLYKRDRRGYILTPLLLILLALVGIMVIVQTMTQNYYGIRLPLPQLIGLVGTFVILGGVAIPFAVKFLKLVKT